MRISNVSIPTKTPLALAPMAGYTNVAMREMMAQMGADIVYSELASAAALSREYKMKTGQAQNTCRIIRSAKNVVNAIQIFGANAQEIEGAIKFIEQYLQTQECRAKIIDLNLGCPATKVCTIGAGCELLKDVKKLEEIIKVATRTSSLAITVKMRLLPNIDESITIAKMFEKNGIDAIAIHGRTQKQKFGGFANWGAIGQIKRAVNIPVIGNGDVKTFFDAKKILKISNCDAIMIGRASLENPFVFLQIKDGFANRPIREIAMKDKCEYLNRYIDLCKKYEVPFVESKELAVQLVSGVRGASKARDKIVRACNTDEIMNVFREISQEPK